MTAAKNLWTLAEAAGIEPRYWDILGQLHETTADTARTLLRALGLPADSDGEIAMSLAALDDEKWQNILPPIIFGRENEEVVVPLRVPLDRPGKMAAWTVRLESGEQVSGECDVFNLPVDMIGNGGGTSKTLRHLKLAPLPLGYHEFHFDGEQTSPLTVTPARCFLPSSERRWGIAAQLYALKSSTDWGIGDFGDLRELVELAAGEGADAIGLNPLHALFLDAPDQSSPYSPNSRLFRNPLYIDVASVPDFEECPEARALAGRPEMERALSMLRAETLVQYRAVADIKLALLERLHRSFQEKHVATRTARGTEFLNFVQTSGPALERFAAFQSLSAEFGHHNWRSWPADFSDCNSSAVSTFAQAHAQRISFFIYLQWLCEVQLRHAADTARNRGMTIGLYNDLAISADAASADHWAQRDLYVERLRVGAPPDPFNERGQEWGVVPINPRRLKATGYAHFMALLRANMQNAGALRIDHVMGWQRLFLIPAGAPPASGAYVRFPLDDMLAIACLESQRNHCLLIGEDLGTVPDGFRDRMAAANVLSCRVFYFEREHGLYRRSDEYPQLACVTAATHDLPTLHGFWDCDDIAAKARLGILGLEEEARARLARADEKRALLHVLANEGLLPDGFSPANCESLAWTEELTAAVHVYLARTPSILVMVQLDDLADQVQQANVPGTTGEHPNWRRRQSRILGHLLTDPNLLKQVATLSSERGTPHRR